MVELVDTSHLSCDGKSVRVRVSLGVLVHNCFCYTLKYSLKTMLYLIILIRVVRFFLHLLTKLIWLFQIKVLTLQCQIKTEKIDLILC